MVQSPGQTLKVAKGRTVVLPATRIPDLSGPANRQADTHSCNHGSKISERLSQEKIKLQLLYQNRFHPVHTKQETLCGLKSMTITGTCKDCLPSAKLTPEFIS